MARLSRLSATITSAVGVAASRLRCADSEGYDEGVYSLHLFLKCELDPASYLLNQASRAFGRQSRIPNCTLCDLSIWIDANLISRAWILEDPETRNTVAALYAAGKTPEQLADSDLVGCVLGARHMTDSIVSALMASGANPIDVLIQKAVNPAGERVRYVPRMFEKASTADTAPIRLLRAAAYGGLPNPGGIASVEFRVATLYDANALIERVVEASTKRGLLFAMNEALRAFPDPLVRMMTGEGNIISIRTDLYGSPPPGAPQPLFRAPWLSEARTGRATGQSIKMNAKMVDQLGGLERAQLLFRAMITYGDTTPVASKQGAWMLRYCAQTAQSLKVIDAPFSKASESVCICLGCMTVLSSLGGKGKRQAKRGVVLTSRGTMCGVCGSSAVVSLDLTRRMLVVSENGTSTTLCVCAKCNGITKLAKIIGTQPYCEAHAPEPTLLEPHCAFCSVTLYRPEHGVTVAGKPVALCQKHLSRASQTWMTQAEKDKLAINAASKN